MSTRIWAEVDRPAHVVGLVTYVPWLLWSGVFLGFALMATLDARVPWNWAFLGAWVVAPAIALVLGQVAMLAQRDRAITYWASATCWAGIAMLLPLLALRGAPIWWSAVLGGIAAFVAWAAQGSVLAWLLRRRAPSFWLWETVDEAYWLRRPVPQALWSDEATREASSDGAREELADAYVQFGLREGCSAEEVEATFDREREALLRIKADRGLQAYLSALQELARAKERVLRNTGEDRPSEPDGLALWQTGIELGNAALCHRAIQVLAFQRPAAIVALLHARPEYAREGLRNADPKVSRVWLDNVSSGFLDSPVLGVLLLGGLLAAGALFFLLQLPRQDLLVAAPAQAVTAGVTRIAVPIPTPTPDVSLPSPSYQAGVTPPRDNPNTSRVNNLTILPGEAVGDVRLGQAVPEHFLAEMGAPTRYAPPGSQDFKPSYSWGGIDNSGVLGALYIRLGDQDTNVKGIAVSVVGQGQGWPDFRTREGIGLGSSFERVKATYPTGRQVESMMDADFYWEVSDLNTTFDIRDNQVLGITLGRID